MHVAEPSTVNASGLQLRGIQFNYQTPYSMGGNLTLQYQLSPTIAVQAAYVSSQARHLEVFPNNNLPSVIAPVNTAQSSLVPFPDFGFGELGADGRNSGYNGLQMQIEKRFGGGLDLC